MNQIKPDCIFCQIVNRQAPAKFVYKNELIAAFYDLKPDAPEHILIVPKKHLTSLNEVDEDDAPLLAALWLAVRQIAAERQLTDQGYRVIVNTGAHGGQIIPHLHLHLLGGRPLGPLVANQAET